MPLDEVHLTGADSIRDKRAVNTLKDHALQVIEGLAKQKSEDNRKSKFVLLYGADHADDLKGGFDNLGLISHTLSEAKDDPVKRNAEHAKYVHHVELEQEAYDIEDNARIAAGSVKKRFLMTARKQATLQEEAYRSSVLASITPKGSSLSEEDK